VGAADRREKGNRSTIDHPRLDNREIANREANLSEVISKKGHRLRRKMISRYIQGHDLGSQDSWSRRLVAQPHRWRPERLSSVEAESRSSSVIDGER
jgi:hypothetical protein